VLAAVPQRLADAAYDLLAGRRQRLFARPDDVCPLMPPHMRERFPDLTAAGNADTPGRPSATP
jgi:predicted DCC family thiol-disulfide oxidoreductase YuxK